MLNRRQFVKSTAMAGAGALMLRGRAWPFAQTPTNIRKFVVSLPGIGSSAGNEIGQYIPLATKQTINFCGLSTDTYNVAVAQFHEKMHPDLVGNTDFFGYVDTTTWDQQYLGGAIVAKRGTPVLLSVTNQLPKKHILPVDPTIMAGPNGLTVGDLPMNRIATHLHGGQTPWFSDGTPFQWFTPSGQHGPCFMNVPGSHPLAGTGTYYYPNQQSARLVWYHDHAMGITRLNAYAGIASAYILIDDFETSLVSSGLLPDLVGIPLVIQDKSFVGPAINHQDPNWRWGGPGSLWYPHDYEANCLTGGVQNPKGRWDWGPTADVTASGTNPLPSVSVVPECFFDTILINGGIYPKVSVPPKRVRFRLLNGSQARFYHLNLYQEDSSHPSEAKVRVAGPKIYQFGTEGGFLPAVAVHDNTTSLPLQIDEDPSGNTANPDGPFNLLLAPAERADVVIDFNGVPAGSSFILYNDSTAPFPGGDTRNDYFTGNPDQTAIGGAPQTRIGYGPNTRTLLRITVSSGSDDSMDTASWLKAMDFQLQANFASGNQPALLYNNGVPWQPGPVPYNGVVNRMLTLNEDFDEYGRLIQTIGTDIQNGLNNQGLQTWGLPYMAPSTENPSAGATEVWQIMNLTGDTHPIHFHLVNVQIIQRQPFAGDPSHWSYTGPAIPPDANELGWKETVRMNPGEITTIAIQFNLPVLPQGMGNPLSPRTGGHEYVWHCHILEHEEHDMMRPLVIS
jgi:spore coat protein A